MNPVFGRFGSAQGPPRTEDAPLLAGRGRFTDDLAVHGEAQTAFVRSPAAHAAIRNIDAGNAAGMPGVLAVLTGRDLAEEGIGAIPPLVLLPGRGGKPISAVNAVLDALASRGIAHLDLPMTPQRIWAALHAKRPA